jgi:branched-chain amino acid transport system ATP-binding protein
MLHGEGKVTGGHVYLHGKDVTNHQPHTIVPNGLIHVLEGRYVFPDLSVLENLQMGAYTRKDRDKIDQEIEYVLGYFPSN